MCLLISPSFFLGFPQDSNNGSSEITPSLRLSSYHHCQRLTLFEVIVHGGCEQTPSFVRGKNSERDIFECPDTLGEKFYKMNKTVSYAEFFIIISRSFVLLVALKFKSIYSMHYLSESTYHYIHRDPDPDYFTHTRDLRRGHVPPGIWTQFEACTRNLYPHSSVQAFSTPWFLFANSTNHHLVFFLLETFNNIIQYQFDGEFHCTLYVYSGQIRP